MCLFQAHVYGDAWSPEDQQPHSDQHHVGSLPRRPQDPGRVPEPDAACLTGVIQQHSLPKPEWSRTHYSSTGILMKHLR